VRLARRDVRDHIKYSKTGCWRSYRFYRASQRLKSPTCIICEILEARDFRVFQHNLPKPEVGGASEIAMVVNFDETWHFGSGRFRGRFGYSTHGYADCNIYVTSAGKGCS